MIWGVTIVAETGACGERKRPIPSLLVFESFWKFEKSMGICDLGENLVFPVPSLSLASSFGLIAPIGSKQKD